MEAPWLGVEKHQRGEGRERGRKGGVEALMAHTGTEGRQTSLSTEGEGSKESPIV